MAGTMVQCNGWYSVVANYMLRSKADSRVLEPTFLAETTFLPKPTFPAEPTFLAGL